MVELLQQQAQQLTHQQLQGLELLQMSTQELDEYIRGLAQENPMIDLDDTTSQKECNNEDCSNSMLDRLKWLEDNDRQNRFYQRIDQDELDPLTQVGTSGGLEETLVRFVSRQLFRRGTSQEVTDRVCYLAACLDQSGYLSCPIEDLAAAYGAPVPLMQEALTVLRGLEPAGIGAVSLSQCLELQLKRIGCDGPALAIVQAHLESLSRGQFHAIAKALSISQEAVRQAAALIRELEPRPGAVFDSPSPIRYIQPDVLVVEENGRFLAQVRSHEQAGFQVNPYYLNLLEHSDDSEVRTYLSEKFRQVKELRSAIAQRESTLQRCAQALVEQQQDFFRLGAAALRPMTMRSIAAQLEVHESTISRTVREKFLQCKQGVFPLRYFFSSVASGSAGGTESSGAAARAVVQELIAAEDKAHPLSDQQLAERMAQMGCPISRRTVAKYREELHIPNTSSRRIRNL